MTEQDKQQLNLEISHIFESGANHERIFNMVEMFIDRRYQALTIPVVIVSDFCECDGVQDLHAMTGECRKCGKECTY